MKNITWSWEYCLQFKYTISLQSNGQNLSNDDRLEDKVADSVNYSSSACGDTFNILAFSSEYHFFTCSNNIHNSLQLYRISMRVHLHNKLKVNIYINLLQCANTNTSFNDHFLGDCKCARG